MTSWTRRWQTSGRAAEHETQLVCAVPRCECAGHGVLQVKGTSAEPGSRFTAHFEASGGPGDRCAPIADPGGRGPGGSIGTACIGSWSARSPGVWPAARPKGYVMWAWMRRVSAVASVTSRSPPTSRQSRVLEVVAGNDQAAGEVALASFGRPSKGPRSRGRRWLRGRGLSPPPGVQAPPGEPSSTTSSCG